MSSVTQHIASLKQAKDLAGLNNITRGIEKESLRVSNAGRLATTAHPKSLGSALTHPHITTDYSEALLEFITSPSQSAQQSINSLDELHRITYQHIGSEALWVNSMPCMLGSNDEIPIAQYGKSNSGQMKSIYRLGLGYRYGRAMQTIAGIHFNFSVDDKLWQFLQQQEKSSLDFSDYKTQGYFRLIRNFRRYFWLLLYLFGAAPAVCKSFVQGKQHQLVPVGDDQHSLYTPYATSLRMGDLGYQSSAQDSLVITYNCLDSYIKTLCNAITHPHSEYHDIGIRDAHGHHQQLNDCLLQIENEFYSVIRPKRTSRSGQTALNALSTGGVEYIEVRCLDLNPFDPVGINSEKIHFLDAFLLYCLLEDSPRSDHLEYQQLQENQRRMVYQGRDPELSLYHFGEERKMRPWAEEILEEIGQIAALLDTQNKQHAYSDALRSQQQKLRDPALTPSARIIESLQSESLTFYRWAMNQAQANRNHFLQHPPSQELLANYQKSAEQSLAEQAQREAQDKESFDRYLANYYSQYNYCSETEILETALS